MSKRIYLYWVYVAVFGLAFLGFGLFFPLYAASRSSMRHISPTHAFHLMLGACGQGVVMALVGIGILLWVRWELRLFSARRRAFEAARNGSPPRTMIQPALPRDTEPNSFQVPTTIQLRPRWSRLWALLLVTVLTVEGAGISIALETERAGQSVRDAVMLVSPAILLILVPGWAFLLAESARQRIEVSERGLTVIAGGNKKTLAWTDALIFAVTPPGHRGDAPVCYELAGANTYVRWMRYQNRMPYLPPLACAMRPKATFEEYDRQMEALLLHIAAMTDLPLYDLRPISTQ